MKIGLNKWGTYGTQDNLFFYIQVYKFKKFLFLADIYKIQDSGFTYFFQISIFMRPLKQCLLVYN